MFDSLAGALDNAYRSLVGKKTLSEANVEDAIRSIRQALLEADVHFKVAKELIRDVKSRALGQEVLQAVEPGQQFIKVFHDALTDILGGERVDLPAPAKPDQPLILMMAGLQGSGKTTTCAKLALWLRKHRHKRPLLVAADLQRPAAVEQLETLGKELDLPVHSEGTDARPPQVCRRGIEAARANGHDVVILDTAGRLHVDDALMTELQQIHEVCEPHATLLVCDSMLGQDAVNSALEFHQRLPLYGVVLTKTDGDARGGAALSVKKVTGRPILYVGTGEKPDDLEEFDPPRMAGRILGMGDVVGLVEKAQDVIDEKEAEKQARQMMKGQLTFETFLDQLNMIRRMGPLKKVLGMVPGVGQALKQIDFDDREFKRLEAMILSMTPEERQRPELLDVQRRRRIARGSGNPLQAVHDLVKRFKEMGKMFKRMGKAGLPTGPGGMAGMEDLLGGGGGLPPGAGGGKGGLGGLGGLPGGMPGFPGGGRGRGGRGGLKGFLDKKRR